MSYRIQPGEPPARALRRIAGEQVRSAIGEIDDDELDVHATVHQVRKRCKKIRGLLRLVRPCFPAYSSENAWFRDAARRLSEARDAGALVETGDALAERFAEDVGEEVLGELREALVKRCEQQVSRLDPGERLAAVRDALEAGAARLDGWSLRADGFGAVGPGAKKVYRRARKAMGRARDEPTDENLHEWRKRVKYHRYHLRLLRELWRPVMEGLRDTAERLSDRLGDDHDLAVLRGVLVEETERLEPGRRELLLGLLDQRRKELQAWSLVSAPRLLGAKPKRFAGQLRRRVGGPGGGAAARLGAAGRFGGRILVSRLGDMTYRAARRLVIAVIGTTLALVGSVLLVTPGPGLLVIALALAVLAVEFTWARRWLRKLRHRAGDVARAFPDRKPGESRESARDSA